jgi:PAS domain S-box-containing protein
MAQPLKILIVEDNPVDAELMLRQLRAEGREIQWERVDTEAAYLARLPAGFDLILSDYQMPQFDGLRALQLLKRNEIDIPFILISGTIGEDTAVQAMKDGASDYLLKDRLGRLGTAVTNVLAETRLRREREEAEKALRLARSQLGQLLEYSPAVLYVLKVVGDKVIPYLVSENITALLGFAVVEVLTYEWWLERLHPNDRERAVKSVASTIASGSAQIEYRLRHKDGHYCWVDDNRRMTSNPGGEPSELIGVWTDITERKRAEEVVRQASGRAVQNQKKYVRIELVIILSAAAAVFALGFRYEWFEAGTRWIMSHSATDLDDFVLTAIFLMTGLAVFAFRRWRESESSLTNRHLEQSALALLHDELERQVRQRTGELGKLNQALSLDIAERKRAEAALIESEGRFRELAETVHEVFWVTNPAKNEMLYISPAYERIWGRTCDSLYESPNTWLDAIHPDDRERVLLAATTNQAKGTYDEEYRIVRPDGSERWIHDRAFPVHAPDGALQRVVGAAEDITESKKLQEQFLRAQRMEAIGTLAGGIAHDLNNILAPMLMAPGLLRKSLQGEMDLRMLDMIEQAAQRGSNVVRQLLTFSRGTGGERVSIQLRHLFKEMTEIMRETFPRDITIETYVAGDLAPVSGDATQLHQVLLNLCVNARDAMPRGGKLSLTAKNIEVSQAEAEAHPPAKAGRHVAMIITDTGQGMTPAIMGRIFDPFFTTKELSKGTGLGLSTVLGIVRSHQGYITVASKPGDGTAFTIYLPCSPHGAGSIAASVADALPTGQQELVLVVDDEEPIRTATRLTLEQHNYRVLTANDGAEALMLYMQNRNSIRLVLTDMMMPAMGGLPLIRALRAVDPKVKVLAATGLNDQAAAAELEAAGVSLTLGKPFGPRELLEAVRLQLTDR